MSKQLCLGLNDDAQKIHNINIENGFDTKKLEIGTVLMLIVSELSEALEADRGRNFSKDPEKFNWCDDWLAGTKSIDRSNFVTHFKDTFEDEIADTFIRLLDLCAAMGIDIEWHINQKANFNSTREYKHGGKEY